MSEQRTTFEPDVHGFHFPNQFSTVLLPKLSWGPIHTPQVALGGLCGGMSFAALDYYFAGRPAPTHTAADYPAPGVPGASSRLREQILRRHLTSVGFNPSARGIRVPGQQVRVMPGDLGNLLRYPRLRLASTSTIASTMASELSRAMASLAAGTPVPIGLVAPGNLFESHQVIAIGYDDSAPATRLFLYDCRSPDVTATLAVTPRDATCVLDAPGDSSEPWRAFFVEQYSRNAPAYSDLVLAGPAAVELAGGKAAVRFTVRNAGDADAHAAALGVRAGGNLAATTEPVGVLAPAAESTFDHQIVADATAAIEPVYVDSAGRAFALP